MELPPEVRVEQGGPVEGERVGPHRDVLHDAAGEPAAALIFFEDDINFQPRINITSVLTVHFRITVI